MKRRHEVLVGVLIIVVMVIGVVGTIWLVRGGLSGGYPMYARFPWGAGLKQGQPVRLAGVQVGYVKEVELDPTGTVLAEMAIERKYRIPVNTTASVVPVGIFGDAEIALVPERPRQEYLPEGDTIPVGKSPPTTAELLARMDTIGQGVSDITEKFRVELVDNGGIADLRKTLAATNELVTELGTIADAQSRALSATMATLRRSVSALDSATIDSTMQSLRATTANAERLTADLTQTSARLNAVLAKVDSGDGTAARLLNDPALYQDLRVLVSRLDSLTADVKANPKRYINLSIF